VPIRPGDLFEDGPLAHDAWEPYRFGSRRLHHFHMQLRIATNGYNVSFEKPVVVGHDCPMPFPLADCSIDDCHNGR
jgi:hypothetical protein